MKRSLAGLVVCVVLLGAAVAPARAEDPTFERTLERLEHPLLGERERALEELVSGLPDTRAQVIEALPKAPWVVKLQLAHVLAADGSAAAVEALLDLFGDIDDVQSSAIDMRIARDRAASEKVLTRFRASPKLLLGSSRAKARLRDLALLLRRAEIEEKFLDHKSRTGGTGYYKGQYDGLKYDRELALQVVSMIALDEAFPVPGRYTTGKYQFLRPRGIDWYEIRDMAMNAVAELGTPGDIQVLTRLERYARRMEDECKLFSMTIFDGSWGADADDQERQEDLMDLVGRWGDVVAALYGIDPDREANEQRVHRFLGELWEGGQFSDNVRFHWWPATQRAATKIRVGWYQDAIREFDELTRSGTSRATYYYNLACAYASWSLDPGDRDAGDLRFDALRNLRYSVAYGWTDIGWMEQDRDLDPIRDTDQYRELVKQIEADLGLEPPKRDGR